MLITPRLYAQYRSVQDSILLSTSREKKARGAGPVYWSSLPPDVENYVRTMLLVHQTGSVHVGEIVRYTVTYTPSRDRVRPVPSHLHVRIRNTCAIALRAAYLHGPYTLYAACYPQAFNPNAKYDIEEYGEPQFEPMLKAGGSWTAKLRIPEKLRAECEEPSSSGEAPSSCTWIVECTSQVLFSTSAQVHYEVIIGRDEKSVEVGFAGLTGSIHSTPGRLVDHQEARHKENETAGPAKGVYSNAITVIVEDTATLWDKPKLSGLEHSEFHELRPRPKAKGTEIYPNEVVSNPKGDSRHNGSSREDSGETQAISEEQKEGTEVKKKKIHLVVITHGLHSNLGADMLYMKESIDAAAKQARIDARIRRKASLTKIHSHPIHDYTDHSTSPPESDSAQAPATSTAPLSGGQEDLELEKDEEEVVVRGFSGNAMRTERGIQYLGKRLAKYVLGMTYPDQEYLPVKKSIKKTLTRTFTSRPDEGEVHHHSSVKQGDNLPLLDRPYKITSISFIGHSLGGLTQTYAIAYIHKHSPEFFNRIQPVNFIALASPLLGLSNENPLYVRFALDFGLVGRTGQDLGLTWRAPTIARSGWAGMIAGIGTEKQRAPKRVDPGTKPLLRLLPSGPAHQALRMFRNRTVYSNVVNDGIVPLRTSCLLFLDWRGLGRVQKARRENGLIGTMAGWGWAELTGTNSTEHRSQWPWQRSGQSTDVSEQEVSDEEEASLRHHGDSVPQPADDAASADYSGSSPEAKVKRRSFLSISPTRKPRAGATHDEANSPLAGFMSFFGGSNAKKPKQDKLKPEQSERKQLKAIKRAQTLKLDGTGDRGLPSPQASEASKSPVTTGDASEPFAPPKTSVFEAAGDLLNPPLPPLEFIVDPESRPRTIFHDRVYHPEDIPPPPVRRKSTLIRRDRKSSDASENSPDNRVTREIGSMPVEEKIARAYHRDLSWRKVLVRLSPDAHNNIVVRRMFANAYGWPVVKHLVDTHFADTHTALTADRKEENVERARPMSQSVNSVGDEVKGQRRKMSGDTIGDDERQVIEEAMDQLKDMKGPEELKSLASSGSLSRLKNLDRQDSVSSSAWTDRFFDGDDGDSSDDDRSDSPTTAGVQGYTTWRTRQAQLESPRGTSAGEVDEFLHGSQADKGKRKEQGTAPNLILPVSKVVESPPSLSPVMGLGGHIESRMHLGSDKKNL